ncbi:unnamed protein product [Rotaria magnacalcarata]|uniref:Protein kinase domain-containing protein n=2 Tax=Rotaria magnacalcarata TaxID=392030 RepID=A0A816TWZ6_9BILA|nr:unnamed protein product [Rotaria magnacalcarata]CAF1475706.1 unnamed protein product [Rotaria magnacalcarata]CAF1928085.1 unnamed protein product [Rotaria magnacalcarata]CAF2106584.1 unnamed protein product [Rotaria magnacalcarata]
MGGILNLFSRLSNNDNLVSKVVFIHGRPYVFQRRLGSGGFGAVYAARSSHGMPVAVKVIHLTGLPPDRAQNLVQVYLNEVQNLERLRQESRHVVVIHDFDFDAASGTAYIVMELGGETLSTLIQRLRGMTRGQGPSIDPMMIKEFWNQMVNIVGTLHANRIVHMDLKPDNLILFGSTLKIADLGISKKSDALGQARMGTPFFSAPEIMEDTPGFQRSYGPKADIWSLGAILYFMVYGVRPKYHPFAADPPFGLPRFPDPALNDVLRRTLVRNPHARADIQTIRNHPFSR